MELRKEKYKMIINILRWIAVLALAFVAGKLMTKIKMPSILGWLIAGMILGPHAIKLMPQSVLNADWYKTIIMWMQCASHDHICSTLASAPEMVQIVQGTIAAAAVINEFIAVITAKKGFDLAGEIF